MRAIVSDQGLNFESGPVSAGNEFTVIAALELPRGAGWSSPRLPWPLRPPDPSMSSPPCWLDGNLYSPAVQSDMVPDGNSFVAVPLMTGLALDRAQTVQVGCRATAEGIACQMTTLAAIQVESVHRIGDQYLGGPRGSATGGVTD